MKYRLYVFSIMFLIWCGINVLTTLIFKNRAIELGMDLYLPSFHLINIYSAFIFSVLAVVSVRYFYLAGLFISVLIALCLIPGLMQGDITGHNGFIPVEKILNSIFVHNEIFLIAYMYLFNSRLSLNLTLSIILSDAIIILVSAYLIEFIRRLSVRIMEPWWRKQMELEWDN